MEYKDYETVPTGDGSFTLFSKSYNQCYHSTKDGALVESLHKHVIPAFTTQDDKDELCILDICFGLGYNTLATLYYNDKHDQKKLKIFSPELDISMLETLDRLTYPEELQPYVGVLKTLLKEGIYKDEHKEIHLYRGDARVYIKSLDMSFDIVYQDAFSPDDNPLLWTKEYFTDIKLLMKDTAVLTTYSIALKVRKALYENGFEIYLYESEKTRSSTLACMKTLPSYDHLKLKHMNMEHKIALNPQVDSLKDKDFKDV